jgi:hypothetical protein
MDDQTHVIAQMRRYQFHANGNKKMMMLEEAAT